MNPETLESLLLDRALGELSPPVAALLEEHLARNPSVAQRAASLTETTQLAGRSLADSAAQLPLRARTDHRWIQRAAWQARWRANLIGLAKLAACLALGIFLGRAGRPEIASPVHTSPALVAAPALPVFQNSRPKFWSLASRMAGPRRAALRAGLEDRAGQLLWKSPLNLPHLEDKP